MVLSQDFKEFIELLNSNKVHYLVIGGYALAAHGCPRYTKDIDIWIDTREENANNLVEALKQFGFGGLGLKASDFIAKNRIVQLGYPPNRIDLITSADGLEFDETYAKRQTISMSGVELKLIDLESLKINKTRTGRMQDLADLQALESLGKQ